MCVLFAFAACSGAHAQTPHSLSAPDLHLYTNGRVYASSRQADGSIIIGGRFTQVNGAARAHLAKFSPDGTLDPNWNPSTDYSVFALASDGKGNVYIGGTFTTVNNQLTGNVAKISGNGNGALDDTWHAITSPTVVYALAVTSTSDVIVGGRYDSYYSLIKLSGTSGRAAITSLPRPNGTVRALALDKDDTIYVAGDFRQIGDQARPALAKILNKVSDATNVHVIDADWSPSTSSGSRVYTLTLDGNGNLYVGGQFTTIGGQTHSNIAKLSSTGAGTADSSWNPTINGTVKALSLDGKGNLYLGGSFTSIGGQSRFNMARVSTSSNVLDASWSVSTDTLPDSFVDTIVLGSNGDIYVGGLFSTIGGKTRHSFASINASGTPTTQVFDATIPGGVVNAIATQPNGGLIVGGYFSGSGNLVRNNVMRLRPDGSVDASWDAPTDALGEIGVEALAVDSSNAVYLGGEFTQAGGQPHVGIAKVSSAGAVDATWGAETFANGSYYGVQCLALSATGDVYLGGDFNLIGAQTRSGLAKISGNGVLDPNWNPAAAFNYFGDGGIRTLEVDSDGIVFAAGHFSKIGGPFISGLVKLSGSGAGDIDSSWTNSSGIIPTALKSDHKGNLYAAERGAILKLSTKDGTMDPNWGHSVSGGQSFTSTRGESGPQIYALALDTSNSLYVGGIFTQAGGTDPNFNIANPRSRPFLAKFSTLSGDPVDTGWNPVPNGAVYALASGNNNTLYVGGSFSQIGIQQRSAFAAVPAPNAADPTIPDHLNQFGWTGAWYDPTTSGQGVLLQVIPGQDGTGTLFGGWFTYDSPYSDRGTGLRWYTLQGPIDKTSKTASVPVYATEFYSPVGKIIPVLVGDALITFADCTHGSLVYSVSELSVSSTGQRNLVGGGIIALTRLGTNPACTATGDSAYPADFMLSGAWYDPSVASSGLLFDIDPGLNIFFAAWYRNIDVPGPSISSQRWYTIQAPYLAGTRSLDDMPIYLTSGGVFDTPSKIATTRVGTTRIVFSNCATATLTYSFTGGPEAGTGGTLNLSRGAAKPASCNP